MRIAVAANDDGCSTSWWCRLKEEGNDVLVYQNLPKDREHDYLHVGDGLVNKETNYDRLLEWAQDGVRSGIPTLMLFTDEGLGEKADDARKRGIYTVCGGGFMDRLENDRCFGFDVAAEAGANLPPYQHFESIQEARKAAEAIDEPTYFKSDERITLDDTKGCDSAEEMIAYLDDLLKVAPARKISCMLQLKIEGVPISTGRWWNGRSWVGPYLGDIEHKKFMNDEIGPSTGCSFNATWFYRDTPSIARGLGWERLTPIFLANEAPAGWYDINALVDKDGHYWFLEWTPRLGYDSEMTSHRLYDDLGSALWYIATGQGGTRLNLDEIAFSTRVSTPPYPWEHSAYSDEHTCLGRKVHGVDGLWDEHFIPYQIKEGDEGMEVAGTYGLIGLSLAIAPKLSTAAQQAVDYAKTLECKGGTQFRTDGGKVVAEDAKQLRVSGVTLPDGLLE